jgi:hypothetical protein
MMQIGLIGLGAGAVAALLFASLTSGAWLAVLLFYLAPLPIMIAGLGWSHWSALIAAVAGALAVGGFFGGLFFFGFLAGAGLPAWWLCYLTMLARPVNAAGRNGGGGTPHLEWYPTGRLVIWAALLGALVVVIAIPMFGTDADSFRASLAGSLKEMLQIEGGEMNATRFDRLVGSLVVFLPSAAAVVATVTSLVNLWLAARIVKFSGLLKRPWPHFPEMTFPRSLAAVLALAIVVNFAGGMPGIVAGILSASLLIAYGVLGFAVLHALTFGIKNRPLVLGGVYASVIVFSWPVLALCLLGLGDTALNLRARAARKRGLPPPT